MIQCIVFVFFFFSLGAEVKILYTAALIHNQFDSRKEEYLHSLFLLDTYGFLKKTYIVDSCTKQEASFFESYSNQVIYAGTNDHKWINKGVNEALAILKALDHFSFHENDLIIKLTGRYFLDSDKFLKIVEDHPEIDLFVKFDPYGQVFTGCYAIRCRYLREFLQTVDLQELNDKKICIETKAAEYVQKAVSRHGAKLLILEHLDVTANIFGWGERDYTHW